MTAHGCFLCLVALLLAGPAQAVSVWTKITPTDLNQHQLLVAVSVSRGTGQDTFRVSVRPRPGMPYHFVMDNAEAWFEDVNEGRNHISLPKNAATPIEIVSHGKQGADFRFRVPRQEMPHRRFAFGYAGYDTGQRIMPAGDFYWFNLSAFASPAARGSDHFQRTHRRPTN